MINIPKKASKLWYSVTIVIFLVLISTLLSSRLILSKNMDPRNIIAFVVLSAILSIIAGIGGYLGGKVYFIVTTFFYLIAIINLFYNVITVNADGWTDLTSMMSFIFIIGGGVLLGLVVQVVYLFINRKT